MRALDSYLGAAARTRGNPVGAGARRCPLQRDRRVVDSRADGGAADLRLPTLVVFQSRRVAFARCAGADARNLERRRKAKNPLFIVAHGDARGRTSESEIGEEGGR